MKKGILHGALVLSASVLVVACGQPEISYQTDVQPVLKQYCLECHDTGGAGAEKSGLVMATYEGVMQGTRFGAIVKPGDTLTSTLIMLVEGRADPSIKMPHGKESMPQAQIDVLKRWVEQGAKNN